MLPFTRLKFRNLSCRHMREQPASKYPQGTGLLNSLGVVNTRSQRSAPSVQSPRCHVPHLVLVTLRDSSLASESPAHPQTQVRRGGQLSAASSSSSGHEQSHRLRRLSSSAVWLLGWCCSGIWEVSNGTPDCSVWDPGSSENQRVRTYLSLAFRDASPSPHLSPEGGEQSELSLCQVLLRRSLLFYPQKHLPVETLLAS